MERDPLSDESVRNILLSCKTIAVIGMSRDPSKDAHHVPKYLFENGYDVIPVNPSADKILDKPCYSSISDVPQDIDIVDIFRPSEQVLPFVQAAIKKEPKVIWLQEGIHNTKAEKLASEAGIQVIFNRCIMVEHQRLLDA